VHLLVCLNSVEICTVYNMQNLCYFVNAILLGVIKSSFKWAEHVAKMGRGEMDAKSWSKNLGSLGRRTHRCECNVNMDI
jgi:hypothetical protein